MHIACILRYTPQSQAPLNRQKPSYKRTPQGRLRPLWGPPRAPSGAPLRAFSRSPWGPLRALFRPLRYP